MRTPTDYRKLRNRCSGCGHRLVMILGRKCYVVTGDPNDPTITTVCECRRMGK